MCPYAAGSRQRKDEEVAALEARVRGAIGRKDEARPGLNHARHVIYLS